MEKIDLIKSQRYFKDLPPEHLQSLASCADFVRFDADTEVFSLGQTATQFYLLISGSVNLTMPSSQMGNILIQKLYAGDLLGWSWLYPPHKWHFDAVTNEDTVALAFNVTAFLLLCEQDAVLSSAIYQRFSRLVVERLQVTRLQLIEMSEQATQDSLE